MEMVRTTSTKPVRGLKIYGLKPYSHRIHGKWHVLYSVISRSIKMDMLNHEKSTHGNGILLYQDLAT